MKMLTVNEWGSLSRKEADLREPKGKKIRIKVKYAGVGRTDLTAVRGGYLLAPRRPFSPGYEVVGTDPAGQRVVALLPVMGAYRPFVDLDPQWVVPVPPKIDDQTAASLPLNYLTALALLDKTTRLSPGAKVLVHGAGGGVGLALLELARERGLKTYGVASVHRQAELTELGAVLVDRNADWVAMAKELVPEGYDAVFDAQGVVSFRKSWKVLGRGGVLAAFGFALDLNGGSSHYVRGLAYLGSKFLYPSGKRVAVCGLPAIAAADPAWYRRSMTKLFEAVASGTIRPKIQAVFGWDKVEEAHAVIEEGRGRGKLLLDFQA